MRGSIRFRLTAWYAAALAAALFVVGGATYVFTRASLYGWLDGTLLERADALAEEVRLVGQEPQLSLTPLTVVGVGYMLKTPD